MSPVHSAMHTDRVVRAQGLGWSSGLERALREKGGCVLPMAQRVGRETGWGGSESPS